MHCPSCSVEFRDHVRKCPACRVLLVNGPPPKRPSRGQGITYEDLVRMVRGNDGRLSVRLTTTDVARNETWRFAYRGFGHAWARTMEGAREGVPVVLRAAAVGVKEHSWWVYFGFGYAWVERMEGLVGGNPIVLTATDVGEEREMGFPYLGYGYAWTKEMAGDCGGDLRAALKVTDVGRQRRAAFPCRGHGQAWANAAVLTLTAR